MLVHRSERSQLQRMRNLLEAWRVAIFVQERHQIIQDLFLPFRQRHCEPPEMLQSSMLNVGESKAKVNSTLGPCTAEKSAFNLCGGFPRFDPEQSLRRPGLFRERSSIGARAPSPMLESWEARVV